MIRPPQPYFLWQPSPFTSGARPQAGAMLRNLFDIRGIHALLDPGDFSYGRPAGQPLFNMAELSKRN